MRMDFAKRAWLTVVAPTVDAAVISATLKHENPHETRNWEPPASKISFVVQLRHHD